MSRQSLIVANSHEEKYFINEEFKSLPEQVKEDLIKIAVTFVADVGGIFELGFDVEDTVEIYMEAKTGKDDFMYDDIGSKYILGRIEKEYKELFEALVSWYMLVYIKSKMQ